MIGRVSVLLILWCLVGQSTGVLASRGHQERSTGHLVRHYLGMTRTTQYTLCCVTASGARVFYGELAADPSIPFGAHVVIPGLGTFVVYDRGSAVWGAHLDIWVPYVGYNRIRDYYAGVWWTL